LYTRARQGLFEGVSGWGFELGDEVLAPAYHHGSEIEALRRAGLVCRFYEAENPLEPDADELNALVGSRTRALHLTHVLGFPADGPRWRSWCDERGLVLIEDAAQAWLSQWAGQPVGASGDLAIFCLYKTVGLPIGSALVSRLPLGPRGAGPLGALQLAKFGAGRLLRRSDRFARLLRRRDQASSPEEDMALEDPSQPLSTALRLAISRLDTSDVARRRRANYTILSNALPESVRTPFAHLSDGASPFMFPLVVADKPSALSRLRERRIDAMDFWSVPHPALPTDSYPEAARWRATVVGLPVHQGLRAHDIERLLEAAREVSGLRGGSATP